jgi:transposase-like protein
MDMNRNVVVPPVCRTRRRWSAEFKAQVVATCLEPGISIAAVALANELNTNLLRQWVKDHREGSARMAPEAASPGAGESAQRPPPTLVPVRVQSSAATECGDIRIEIRRQEAVVQVTWPVAQASACAQWLRDLLR